MRAQPFRVSRNGGGSVLERRVTWSSLEAFSTVWRRVARSRVSPRQRKRERKEERKEGRKEIYQCSIEQRYTALLEEGRREKRKGIRLDGKEEIKSEDFRNGERRERERLTLCLDLSLAFPPLPINCLSRLSFPPMGHDTASSRLWDEFAASRPAIMH